MEKTPPQSDRQPSQQEQVFVIRDGSLAASDAAATVEFRELLAGIWGSKWLIIASAAVFAVASIAYAFLATEWYRAEVLLAPPEEDSGLSLSGQLGGLAALAGVKAMTGDSVEALATLKSRSFAREFVEDRGLLKEFFSEAWDDVDNQWVSARPEEIPDIRDAVKYFHDNVLSVTEERETGLVSLTVEWVDPRVAADWANDLTGRLNSTLRERALREAETNVSYLREEMSKTNVVTMQQAIGRLLETEMQKLMLARGNKEFAFRVIDAATPPKTPSRPKKKLIVIVATMLGGMLAVLWAVASVLLRSR